MEKSDSTLAYHVQGPGLDYQKNTDTHQNAKIHIKVLMCDRARDVAPRLDLTRIRMAPR